MRRSIQPELLDSLPQDHPDAIRAREEMQLVNGIMGNHRWIERMIRLRAEPHWRITELGAGDGALSLRLLAADLCAADRLHAVDFAPRPDNWPEVAGWTSGDVMTHPLPETEILVANLFLHHFTGEQLERLGSCIPPSTRLIVAAEPARRRIHCVMGRLFCEIAELNRVQRHDMQASIRAGFAGDELRRALGLGREWDVRVREHPLGGYRFVAERRMSEGRE